MLVYSVGSKSKGCDMRHYSILVGFLPWILFGTLAGHTLLTLNLATIVALVLTIIFNHHEIRHGFTFAWATLLFFLFSLIFVVLLNNAWVMGHMNLILDSYLVLISWGSLVMGRPFTADYAKEHVAKDLWDNAGFKQRNITVSMVWAILFLVNLLITIFYPNESYFFNLLRNPVAIIIGYIITLFIIDKKLGE
jgi:hypothetical protein